METTKQMFFRVRCTHTNNPEHWQLIGPAKAEDMQLISGELFGKKFLKVVIDRKEISLFEQGIDQPVAVLKRKHIIGIECHPLSMERTERTGLHCISCGGNYGEALPACPYCAILYIEDLKEIYENFEYAFSFEDKYYRDAFIKFVSKKKKTKNK